MNRLFNYVSKDKARCAWFDFRLRLWTMHEIDAEGNQASDALYDNLKENAFKWLGEGWTKEEVKPSNIKFKPGPYKIVLKY